MQMPPIIYGTAWKKERTEALVVQALRAGFRAIDTACQPKHSPMPREEQTLEAWRAMEALVDSGGARLLGISNCYRLDALGAAPREPHQAGDRAKPLLCRHGVRVAIVGTPQGPEGS